MNDEQFMKQALREAEKAFAAGEVPVGAVLVINDRVISRGYNQVELLNDPTAHAEMIALTAGFNFLGAKYLTDATLYVTVEPCLMCAGAIYWSKLQRIVWGTADPKNGHARITGVHNPFHPKATISTGVLADEAAALLKSFFQSRR
ncbi:MAG TPA: nucleoside deaminase [Flavihumibacter sp.]|nr:nucleoside deaminase [Flavihumibacter sp.]HQD10252.1 nucleoside deaminase [Flavihumibacter sp.]